MPDIVITEFMDEGPVERLKERYEVHWDPLLWDRPEQIRRLLPGARALIVRNRTPVADDILAAGPQLEVLGRLGVGLDNIDLEACKARGITVCPATGTNHVSVAEYAICAAMMLLRGSFLARDRVLAGEWPREDLIGREARGKTFGLLGFGMIGQAAARMAGCLEMDVIAHDPHLPGDAPAWALAEPVAFEDLLARGDILSVHTPLLPETRGIIDAAAMERMKPGAFIINTARGGIVDEDDMIAALKSGRLGGAALDVFVEEPLTAKAAAKFADAPNLILTPHISGVTAESSAAISEVTVDNVLRELEKAE